MLTKTNADEFQDYLRDASNLQGGHADKFFVPETTEEVADVLKEANENKIPVTISGARTGLVGGAIPRGGYLISLEKFNQIKKTGNADDPPVVENFQSARQFCPAEFLQQSQNRHRRVKIDARSPGRTEC